MIKIILFIVIYILSFLYTRKCLKYGYYGQHGSYFKLTPTNDDAITLFLPVLNTMAALYYFLFQLHIQPSYRRNLIIKIIRL